MSDTLLAVILGVIEGLTEFIPVSSTGHLILFGDLLEFTGDKAQTFQIFIQIGAIMAVLLLYWRRFLDLLPEKGEVKIEEASFQGWSGIIKLFLAALPAFLIGWFFYRSIKEYLFNSTTVAFGLIVGGIMLIWVERCCKKVVVSELERIGFWQSFLVGIFQCLALWPGMSRSGSTIIGARYLGCSRQVAAEFSFLVAVPVMFVAVAYDLIKSFAVLSFADLWLFGLGTAVAFVTAILAVKFFIAVLQRYTLEVFGYYRILLGLLIILLISE